MLHPYLDQKNPIAFVHRGGAGDWPENTIEAFTGSYELGYRYLETDVHLAKDGTIVAFHDPQLDRVGSVSSKIADLDWPQIRSIKVNGKGHIPTMEELLLKFPNAKFNIDMKSDAVVEPLLQLLDRLEAHHRVCIASFFDRRIKRASTLAGDKLCVSTGRIGTARSVFRSLGVPVPVHPAPLLQIPLYRYGVKVTTERFIKQAHKDGKQVHIWTIDEPAEIHRLLDMGVDGIMTDMPKVLKRVFVERGIWST